MSPRERERERERGEREREREMRQVLPNMLKRPHLAKQRASQSKKAQVLQAKKNPTQASEATFSQ